MKSRNHECILRWILFLQIASTSAAYYQNGSWNFNEKFDCNRQRGVDTNLVCNGKPHCRDGSVDENYCKNCCATDAYHCKNERCIPNYLRCDGYDDCWDGSDEWKCMESDILHNKDKYNVPMALHSIDITKQKMMNFSNEIQFNENFAIPMLAYRYDSLDGAMDGRTVIFEHMRNIVFYVHGFMTNDLHDGVRMKNALVDGTDDVDCVILVDWRLGSYYGNTFMNHKLNVSRWKSGES